MNQYSNEKLLLHNHHMLRKKEAFHFLKQSKVQCGVWSDQREKKANPSIYSTQISCNKTIENKNYESRVLGILSLY